MSGLTNILPVDQLPAISNHWGQHLTPEAHPPTTCSFPPNGQGSYKDEYGIIYEFEWTNSGSEVNFLLTIKQPRVWGRPSSNRLSGRQFLQEGLISQHHQVIQVDAGGYSVIGEWFTQELGYYISNESCKPKSTQFCLRNNCYVADNIEARVSTDAWTDIENTTDGLVWTDPEMSEAGPIWIDVWGQPNGPPTVSIAAARAIGGSVLYVVDDSPWIRVDISASRNYSIDLSGVVTILDDAGASSFYGRIEDINMALASIDTDAVYNISVSDGHFSNDASIEFGDVSTTVFALSDGSLFRFSDGSYFVL